MAAAISHARRGLPEFYRKLEAPGPGEEAFALKVGIPADDGIASVEHFWLINITRSKNGVLSGKVNNDPNHTTGVKLGDRYTFQEADVSDWLFMRNGKMVGNAMLRVLLNSMPREQADALRRRYEKP